MTPRSAPTSDTLRGWVQRDFGVEITTLSSVEHGADETAHLWRGFGADGASYAVKLSGAGTPAGLIVSAHLAERDVAGVTCPLMSRRRQPWSERDHRRLSVVPWVSEARALDGEMSAAHWTSYGALLAKVHATEVTESLAMSLPSEDHTHERAASTTRALDSSLRLAVEEPEAGSGTVDALVRALAQEWCTAGDRVLALLEQADGLGRELHTRKAPSVVCHGDPHLGNVLIGQEERVWLIDWDDSVLAPRERDLIFILGGVLAFAPVTQEQQSWFFDGYGATDLDPLRLAYYRCARALEDLAYPAAQIIDLHGPTERERADALSIVRGVLSPTGLVNLALASAPGAEALPTLLKAVPNMGVSTSSTPSSTASEERIAEFSAVLELIRRWAQRRTDIQAVGLAGSWARGAQRPGSDADFVVLTNTTEYYELSTNWIHDALLQDAPVTRTRHWGPVIERRLLLATGFELEFGFATPAWAETAPVDSGTARVVGDGFQVLYDPRGILDRLVDAVRAL